MKLNYEVTFPVRSIRDICAAPATRYKLAASNSVGGAAGAVSGVAQEKRIGLCCILLDGGN